ncbi:MAG: single-stranded DNA-binding protein, partial [Bacteroidetes bacterium]|nr:single-stranded DNA-binding protein [Bacteroidota bacterium]
GSIDGNPELRYTSNNTSFCSLRLVTVENYTNRDGQPVESRSSHTVVVWGQKAERIKNQLDQSPGNSRVLVEGSIRNRSYEDATGNRKWVTEINAQNVFVLGENPAVMQHGTQGRAPQPQQRYQPVQQPSPTVQQPAPLVQQPVPAPQQNAPPVQQTKNSQMPPSTQPPHSEPEDDLPF